MEASNMENFEIDSRLMGDPHKLLVIPAMTDDQDTHFLIVYEGVSLATIRKNGDLDWWEIVNRASSMDIEDEELQNMGREIDNYYR